MAYIYLIRHARTEMQPGLPAAGWPLSRQGREQAERLASRDFWREVGFVYASPEEKALATANPAVARFALPTKVLQDLRELERPAGGQMSARDYAETVAACFDNPYESVHGWETAASAQQRIVAAIKSVASDLVRQNAASSARVAAVVSHGLVLSLFLASLDGRAAPTLAEWRAIPMPAVAVLDCEEWRLVRPLAGLAEDK